MRSNYSRLGDYIREVNVRNRDLGVTELKGININKLFMPSVANIIGVDLSNYKVVKREQFACNLMHVGRDEKIPIAINNGSDIIVSPAYLLFEVVDINVVDPQYLMMWFSRSEFDRQAWFYTDADVRGGMTKDSFFDMPLIIPSIEKQRAIVKEYQTLTNRIKLNETLCAKLEQTAQALYRKMFIDNIDLENLPAGWRMGVLSDIADITMGQSPNGDSYNLNADGIIFYQGRTDFGNRFPKVRMYTTAPTKFAKYGDSLLSVRAPVGDLNIAIDDCCIGRGLASVRSKLGCHSYMYYTLLNLKSAFDVSNEGGTIFGSINKDQLNNLEIIIPASDLIAEYNRSANKIDKYYQMHDQVGEKLIILRDIVLSKLSKIQNN